MPASRLSARRRLAASVTAVSLLVLGGCGAGAARRTTTGRSATATTSATATASSTATATTVTTPLPGTGKPPISVGDKNYTEQFLLGQLYFQALQAQGYSVTLTRNIGTTQVTLQALKTGAVSFYPEYINVWDSAVAGDNRRFTTAVAAYRAGQRYALAHGFDLLNPSPFSDTQALAVNFNYGLAHNLSAIGDLRAIQKSLIVGGPPQFQTAADGLPAVERVYRLRPAAFKPLEIGGQYPALDDNSVQAADVNTTDGQLITGNDTLLSDPRRVFGFGNVVPVVPIKVLEAEGPQFAAILNRVTALLTLPVIRQLNAAVDIDGEDPKPVAAAFLQAHGLLAPNATSGG